ncbi:hypothetical protein [Flavobacterium kingsejongi]|uniref:Uncharacterized protein n=1 Tax=Flavobacterium kingsejongi TaxID=1678728 RepID=A0A2S1LM15_9FLAO|nr:hypothetical protein [Flavobacterium kingsejongi]AWG24810.1 hypothetical protein FK004_05995 [Flavobacterium kingsejongi]AWG25044.1 hypothetical protein FK004_07260 [Flavobacterium kingsejongi]
MLKIDLKINWSQFEVIIESLQAMEQVQIKTSDQRFVRSILSKTSVKLKKQHVGGQLLSEQKKKAVKINLEYHEAVALNGILYVYSHLVNDTYKKNALLIITNELTEKIA